MRKLLLSFAGLGLLFTATFVFSGRVMAFSGSGAGTDGDPYQITDCSKFLEIDDDLAASYRLEYSIDCNGVTFHPIGSGSPFVGKLDGQGNGINNVTISETTDDVGIFATTGTSTITNLRIVDASITGRNQTGALVGNAGSGTQISYISGVNITVDAGAYDNVGGLVGELGGAVITKSFVENVNVAGSNTVGGLVGWAVGPTSVSEAYAIGVVDGSVSGVGGVIGVAGSGPVFVDHIYSDIVFTDLGSAEIGSLGFGPMIGSTFTASAPYLANNTQSPLDGWDFTEVWYIRPGKYPGLRPKTLPYILCSAPSSTDTTANASCTTYPTLEGGPQWELKYRFKDETESLGSFPTQAGGTFNLTTTGLLPGTDYDIQFRFTDAVGQGSWARVQITTTGSSDSDNDSFTNKEEFKGPNSGDGDNDGVPDYQEANVTSFKSFISDKYVTIKTTCTDNFNTQIGLEPSAQSDAAFDYPAGLTAFVVRGCTPGASVPINVFFYGSYSAGNLVARKVKNGVYTTIPGAVLSAVTIGGQSALKLSYSVTDGGSLDQDGIADGNIVDPVGLASSTAAAPNTGLAPAGSQLSLILISLIGLGLIRLSIKTRVLSRS